MLHEEIERYVQLMKSRLWWYGDFDYLSGSFLRRCFKFYQKIRWFSILLLFFATCVGLSSTEFMGLYNGMFVYSPLVFSMFVQIALITYTGEQQSVLTISLNNYFLRHNEPWMNNMRKKLTAPLWRTVTFFMRYNLSIVILYMVVPLILDTILHFGFDSIKSPLVLPLPLNSFYGDDKWNVKFYTILILNWWSVMELTTTIQGPVVHFAVLSCYFQTEMQIFTEKIKMLELDRGSQEDIDEQIRTIVRSHNNLIE